MTDVIVEGKDGETIHYLIPDNYPAIVFVRENGTFRVKEADLTPETQILNIIKYYS